MNALAKPVLRRSHSVAAVLVLLWSSTAVANGPDADAGRRFVEENCAACHATGARGTSPHEAAPPFHSLARKWPVEHLAEALAEGIVVGHRDMPAFELSPSQIDDVLAYLASIQRR